MLENVPKIAFKSEMKSIEYHCTLDTIELLSHQLEMKRVMSKEQKVNLNTTKKCLDFMADTNTWKNTNYLIYR